MNRRFLLLSMWAVTMAAPCRRAVSAKADFGSWPKGTAPVEIGTRVADRFLATPHTNFGRPARPTSITYPETCAWYGALSLARFSHDETLRKKLIARFEPLFGPEADLIPTAEHVDPSVFGAVPFEIYIQNRDTRYLSIGKTIADRQWAAPTAQRLAQLQPEERQMVEQAVKEDLSPQTRFWIDDMYMITALQAQAFRATGDPTYIDRKRKVGDLHGQAPVLWSAAAFLR